MSNLTGKVALVTGGASGIGAGIAREMAAAGAAVAITDIDSRAADELARELSGADAKVIGATQDVTDDLAWPRALAWVEEALGPIDILVNNAGIAARMSKLEDTTLDGWRRVTTVNIDGVFLGVRAGIRAMKERGGAIVNVASILGWVGAPMIGAYGATKHAVRGLTKSAAVECAYLRYPIRINAVCPGYIDTDMTSALKETMNDKQLSKLAPMGRLGTPEEVAKAVVFLASDDARYMTGADLVVDGGYIAR